MKRKPAPPAPCWNPRLPVAQRVDDLAARLTLREKIAQLLHAAPPVPRLGLPAYNWWNECLHGVARAGRATVFPQAIGMAASFNDALMGKVATAISDEARAKHHAAARAGNRGIYFGLNFWSPNINLFRDPRWGRGQETYGEDPHLTARMGVTFVRGLQGRDPRYLKLAATAKHFAVHSGPERLRHVFDAVVSERDLRESYLPAFEALVREAKVESVMGAYNRTQGEPCCGSFKLLQRILREEWGFQGHVVSDCWAIKDFHEGHKVTATPEESVALALKAGCDLNCGNLYGKLLDAVKKGLVSEAEIDRALKRLLSVRFRLGLFDPESQVPYARIPESIVECAAHRRLALRMARESLVLLENRGGILPLDRTRGPYTVIGPNAVDFEAMLGNYNGFPGTLRTVAEAVVGKVGAGVQVSVAKGCELSGPGPVWLGDATLCREAAVIIAVVGYSAVLEGEEGCAMDAAGDRSRYELPPVQMDLLRQLKKIGRPLVVVVLAGSPVDLSWIRENAAAVLFAWYPGAMGGEAVADALFGDVSPAGRLPVTFPVSYDQLPPFEDYVLKGRTYRFMEKEPMYRFGYGLSYTRFEYRKLKLDRNTIRPGQSVGVSVEVRNAGLRASDEVVQLYVSDLEASVPVPRLHLEGFRRIHLKPGRKKTVRFTLRPAQLAAYDDEGRPFVEPGQFRISVGGGQPDDAVSGAKSRILTVREGCPGSRADA